MGRTWVIPGGTIQPNLLSIFLTWLIAFCSRAGSSGEAVSLVSHEDRPLMTAIERLMSREVEQRMVPGFETGPRQQQRHQPGATHQRPKQQQRPQQHQRPKQHQRAQQRPQGRSRPQAPAPEAKNELQPMQYPRSISRG